MNPSSAPFSFLSATRTPARAPQSRITRHPRGPARKAPILSVAVTATPPDAAPVVLSPTTRFLPCVALLGVMLACFGAMSRVLPRWQAQVLSATMVPAPTYLPLEWPANWMDGLRSR